MILKNQGWDEEVGIHQLLLLPTEAVGTVLGVLSLLQPRGWSILIFALLTAIHVRIGLM